MNAFFQNGQTVLFQGDSVTDCGREYGNDESFGDGYPLKISTIYKALFPESGVTFVNRGISGNRVRDIAARYQKDILEVKPDFISILIGINDVWRRYDSSDPTSAEDFETVYEGLLQKIKADLPQTKIMIMEPFVLHSLPDREAWHEDLDPKLQAVRRLATKYADYLLPADGLMASASLQYGCRALAEDGVHPSSLGHSLIATEYLKMLGIL